jgi:hypothetical protein
MDDVASDTSIEMPRSCSVPHLSYRLKPDYFSDGEKKRRATGDAEGVDSFGEYNGSGGDDDTDSLFEEGFEYRRATRKRSGKGP